MYQTIFLHKKTVNHCIILEYSLKTKLQKILESFSICNPQEYVEKPSMSVHLFKFSSMNKLFEGLEGDKGCKGGRERVRLKKKKKKAKNPDGLCTALLESLN